MDNIFEALISELEGKKDELKHKSATVGFDGFIDKVVRVVKENKNDGYLFFPTIESFGRYILGKKNVNCSIEIVESMTKLGGNMPIVANALGNIGVDVKCIGTLGYPTIDPIFKDMENNCELYSIGQPGYSIALEFDDGKVMLGERSLLDAVDWYNIKAYIGLDQLESFFGGSDLSAMVNWGELKHASSIWKGVLDEIISMNVPDKHRLFFFDLADFSERPGNEVEYILELIGQFCKYRKTILSLNTNEALILSELFGMGVDTNDLEKLASHLYNEIEVDILTIHNPGYSIAINQEEGACIESAFTGKPKILTGGGDNYGAGFCIGQLLGMDLACSTLLGNVVAGFYVRYGHSPSIEDVLNFLCRWENKVDRNDYRRTI